MVLYPKSGARITILPGKYYIFLFISDSCSNKSPGNCNSWAQSGECLKNSGWMVDNCRRACNECPDPPPPTTTTTTWAPPTTPGIINYILI